MSELPSLRSLFDLSGKVAIITGGSRGLGLEMAEGLGEAGCKLMINARKESELAEARAYLAGQGFAVAAFPGSVADPGVCEGLVQATVAAFGRIDILVNNAGATWGHPWESHPLDRFEYVLKVNATGTYYLIQQVANQMVAQGGEGYSIINTASVAGLTGAGEGGLATPGYHASKHAVVGLTRFFGGVLAPHNIRVNAICPGFFATKLSRGVLAGEDGEKRGRANPMRRIGRPGEIKGLAVFLASAASGYITGQALPVDGGATAV